MPPRIADISRDRRTPRGSPNARGRRTPHLMPTRTWACHPGQAPTPRFRRKSGCSDHRASLNLVGGALVLYQSRRKIGRIRGVRESWRAGRWGRPCGNSATCFAAGAPSAWPTASSWRAMPPRRMGRPSRPWWRGTGRWSWRPAGPSCATNTTSKTPSRPPSSSWPGRPPRCAPATPWAAGCIGSPIASPCRPISRRSGGVGASRRCRRWRIPDPALPGPEPDLRSIIHEEIDRLPESLRLPVVLCDLEELTYEQAAEPAPLDRADAAPPTLQGAGETPRIA